ncbi:subtilisin-like protease SBT1.1 [Glycine soja]|nr:subtilisin-like protease SBT1.1 [Glycine soja]
MAPSSNVLAAYVPTELVATIGNKVMLSSGYNLLSGTSMACPHASGVAALLKAAHTKWSAAAIRSALVTTASPLDNTQNPIRDYGYPSQYASPLAIGAGLCQQKSEGVDRPQWSTFSHVNYSGSLSSTFGSKVSNNCDDSVLDTSELEKVSLEATILAVKKLDKRVSNHQTNDEFLELINSIDIIRHPNIVELIGYCA